MSDTKPGSENSTCEPEDQNTANAEAESEKPSSVTTGENTVDADVNQNPEGDSGEKNQELLEDKRCAICHEVIVNACRVSCGHLFCRGCIDTQLGDTKTQLEKRNHRCIICDAKIVEVQNCPELDKEINTLFSKLTTEEQLDRAGLKAEKKRNENEKHNFSTTPVIPEIETNNETINSESTNLAEENEQPSSTFTQDYGYYQNDLSNESWYDTEETPEHYGQEPQTIYMYPSSESQNTSEYEQSEDHLSENTDGSDANPTVVVHETFTFHRTRVLNPGNTDLEDLNGNGSSTDPHNFHQNQPNYHPQPPMMTPYYYTVPPPQSSYPPHQPYNPYLPYHPYQCSYPNCYPGQYQHQANNLHGSSSAQGYNFHSNLHANENAYAFQESNPHLTSEIGDDGVTTYLHVPYNADSWEECNRYEEEDDEGCYGLVVGTNSHAPEAEEDYEESEETDGEFNVQINVNFVEMPNEYGESPNAEYNDNNSDSDADSAFNLNLLRSHGSFEVFPSPGYTDVAQSQLPQYYSRFVD